MQCCSVYQSLVIHQYHFCVLDNDDYHWFDETPLDFINWGPGEPSDVNQRCVEMYPTTGKWNDIDCSELLGYVCKYKKGKHVKYQQLKIIIRLEL